MANPSCEVKDGNGAFQPTANGVNVTPGATVTIRLISSAGVRNTWAVSCVGTDELSDRAAINASLVIDPLLKTATFTAPPAGRALIFESVIDGGIDINGTPQKSLRTTFGIFTLTGSGNRVFAVNERFETNERFGWIADFNAWVRSGVGGGSGEANDAANVGGGVGVYKNKVGTTLNLHSFEGTGGIDVTLVGDRIRIDGSNIGEGGGGGEANDAENVGEGAGIYRDKIGSTINLRSLVGTGGIVVTVNDEDDIVEIDGSGIEGGGGVEAGGEVGDLQVHGEGGVLDGLGGAAGQIARRNEEGTAWEAVDPLEVPPGDEDDVLGIGPDGTLKNLGPMPEGGGGGPVPDGTGYRRVVDGEELENAQAVELDGGSTHVSGVLPPDNGGTGFDLAALSGQGLKGVRVKEDESGYETFDIPEGAAVPTGTGYRRVVDGVELAAAQAVNLGGGSTHVSGVLPPDNGGTGFDLGDLTGQGLKGIRVKEDESGYETFDIPEGASVPAGTGFYHITDGVADANAKLVENADVASDAAIAITKLATADADDKVFVRTGGANGFAYIVNANIASGAGISVTKLQAGSNNTVLKTNGVGQITWGAINLASGEVGGTLPIDKGGTNATTIGAAGTVATSNGSAFVWTLIANAHVATNAAIAGTKINPDFGSQNVLTTGYVQTPILRMGSSGIPGIGSIRLPNGGTIYARNGTNNAEMCVMATSGSNNLYLGTNASLGNQWSNTHLVGGASVRVIAGGAEMVVADSSQLLLQRGDTNLTLAASLAVLRVNAVGAFHASTRGISLFSTGEAIPSGVTRALRFPNASAGHLPVVGAGSGGYLIAQGDHLYWVNSTGATPLA